MSEEGKKYTFLKWNGKYGRDSKFVARDNKTGKQSIFTPGRASDLVWTTTDLANAAEMKDWEDFQNESVDDLDRVAF